VIAVGNEFSNTSRSPGNYANVLSVGAIDKNDILADFSSSQKFNRSDDALVPRRLQSLCPKGSRRDGEFVRPAGSAIASWQIPNFLLIARRSTPFALPTPCADNKPPFRPTSVSVNECATLGTTTDDVASPLQHPRPSISFFLALYLLVFTLPH
jgi:hypothetical protein